MAKLVSYDCIGAQPVYDITVDEHHNFIADGVVVHNCMKAAQELAGFSPGDSYRFVKTIAKKIPEKMAAMKEQFFKGAQIRINDGDCDLKDVEIIWSLLETFAGYGFNKSVDVNSPVRYSDGSCGKIGDIKAGEEVICCDNGRLINTEVVANHDHGILPAFECEFEGERRVVCSILHKFETESGKVPLWKLLLTKDGVLCAGHVSGRKLLHVRFVGFRHMCDLEVRHPSHNFILDNGIVTSNSHATAYSAVSTAELWLKHTYPIHFMCALINNTDLSKKKHGSDSIMVDYINYARRNGIVVLGPNVSTSKQAFSLIPDSQGKLQIQFSLSHVKYVGGQARVIESCQPIKDMDDFHERVKTTTVSSTGRKSSRRPNKRVVETLIAAGAFDEWGTRNDVMADYYKVRKNKKDGEPPEHSDDEWIELEREAIGICLSREPLYEQEKETIKEHGWLPIHALTEKRKKAHVFGKVKSIQPHTSKAGNSMFIVTISDDLDSISFFVFRGAMEFFRDNVRVGAMGGFPLDKFEDSDTRFFDDRKDLELIR